MVAGECWRPATPGVLALPSGRLVRGRSLRRPQLAGDPPGLSLLCVADRPAAYGWETWWLPWPDFGLPLEGARAVTLLTAVWERAAYERVEVACTGGRGRTGTALACLAVLDGVAPAEATAYVRRRYSRLAVETRGQAAFVRSFPPPAPPG